MHLKYFLFSIKMFSKSSMNRPCCREVQYSMRQITYITANMWSSFSTLSLKLLKGTPCVTRSTILVLWHVGCVNGHWGVKKREVVLKLWLTAPSYKYTLICSDLDLFQTLPRLFIYHCQHELYPWLTCFPRLGANTASAGKPNKAWLSTPSLGLMMSWYTKYPVTTVPHLSSITFAKPCECVLVYAQISGVFLRLRSDRACF